MFQKLRKVIQKEELFTKKDLLLVGVSGGADSMSLCHFLYEEGYSFVMVHCNYHLRENDSILDEHFLRVWAGERNISIFISSCKLQQNRNIQEEARNLRYAYFNEIKNQEHCTCILTAHHLNDQVETFFINLGRGSGIRGLKGMLHKSGDLIKPLLTVTKQEIYDFTIEHNVPYREDKSNQSNYYLRNFYRNEIIPSIVNRIPSFNEMVNRSMNHLAEVNLLLEEVYKDWQKDNISSNGESIIISKPELVRFYLVSQYLSELGYHPETIDQIKSNYSHTGKIFTDKNGHELLNDRDTIVIRMKKNLKDEECFSIFGDESELIVPWGIFSCSSFAASANPFVFPKNNDEILLDKMSLKFPLLLRKWMPGDFIKPLGMKGSTKKIQDVLTNQKISIFGKEKIYVLISGNEIVWIPGIMRSEVAKIEPRSESILRIEYKKI